MNNSLQSLTRGSLVVTLLLGTSFSAGGCKRSKRQVAPAPRPSVSASVAHPATTQSSPPGTASASAPNAPSPQRNKSWTGQYESKKANLHPPEKVHDYTWKEDDGSLAVGKGSIEFRVDTRGDVHGKCEGPLGKQLVSGRKDGHLLRLAWTPVGQTSVPMACTGVIGETKDVWKGTVRCSGPKGRIVREVEVRVQAPSKNR